MPNSQRNVSPKELKEAGAYIQKHIGALLVNISEAVKQMEEAQEDLLKAMTSKLAV